MQSDPEDVKCGQFLSIESGLYTCSSSNSQFFESDADASHISENCVTENALKLALYEGRRLRSALERLTKSEQWYKKELQQQKTTRLEDLEKIYTQERNFLKENRELQKECVQLYDKCFRLEMKIERLRKGSHSRATDYYNELYSNKNTKDFDVKQKSFIESDHQFLIDVLRQQKKTLLEDITNLSESKDEKILELQMLLAELECDNKQITKLCENLSKEINSLKTLLNEKESEINTVVKEKVSLQKTLEALREQYVLQETQLRLKEDDSTRLQENFKRKMQTEQDLDEIHSISVKYHEEIMNNANEIKVLKNQLSCMHHEIEEFQELHTQNEQQSRLYQLNFLPETSEEIRQTDVIKAKQFEDMQKANQKLLQEQVKLSEEQQNQKGTLSETAKQLKSVNEKLFHVQQQYKEIKFELELLKLEHGKLKFEKDNNHMEICLLRQKLTNYMQQITELIVVIQNLKLDLKRTGYENDKYRHDSETLRNPLPVVKKQSSSEDNWLKYFQIDFLELSKECKNLQTKLNFETPFIKIAYDALGQLPIKEFNATTSFSELLTKIQKNVDKVQILNKDKHGTILSLAADLEKDKKKNIKVNATTFIFIPHYASINKLHLNQQIGVTNEVISSNKEEKCGLESLTFDEQLKKQFTKSKEKESQFVALEMIEQEKRIQLLQKLLLSQKGKTLCIQNNQKDLEDLLQPLQFVYEKEEQMRKELDLKTRELEELNLIFGKQNEELKRLEEFTIQIGLKEHLKKKQLETQFSRQISELEQELQKSRRDAELYQKRNFEQQTKYEQTMQICRDAYAKEIEKCKREICYLNVKLEENERKNKERIALLEEQVKYYKSCNNGVIMDHTLNEGNEFKETNSTGPANEKIYTNHLYILTKVLEAEYDRKRYDEQNHSNVDALKKSMNFNEQKTAVLEEKQKRTINDLKENRQSRSESQYLRFEYEKIKNINEEKKEALVGEKNEKTKFWNNHTNSYEMPNLIDDFKKLILQSALVTKRPTTAEVIDLIQRSNHCVPNLNKIESNLADLQSDLQTHLATCTRKMAGNSLVNTSNLIVPPSLMEELKTASNSF